MTWQQALIDAGFELKDGYVMVDGVPVKPSLLDAAPDLLAICQDIATAIDKGYMRIGAGKGVRLSQAIDKAKGQA